MISPVSEAIQNISLRDVIQENKDKEIKDLDIKDSKIEQKVDDKSSTKR
jgi:hypothetical protein